MFLDGYIFIWDIALLIYLIENNILSCIFASQVYMWSQSNNNKQKPGNKQVCQTWGNKVRVIIYIHKNKVFEFHCYHIIGITYL